MNEQAARDIVLVRALENADRSFELLSEDDRRYASRSARELAGWQAAHAGDSVTPGSFLQQRAAQILKRMSERFPPFASFLQFPQAMNWLWRLAPLGALGAGLLLDRISEPHRVDLLSAPLLLILGWSLAVYLGMLAWPLLRWVRSKKRGVKPASLPGLGLGAGLGMMGKPRLPRKLPPVMATALAGFVAEWAQLGAPLAQARLARTVHLGAALFALGAALSLYARGYLSQYSAGWESTFLSASQVHGLLSALFAPATLAFNLQGFSIADIEALRFGPAPSSLGGARWVHLYAATLGLLVILPRLLLAGLAHLRARRLTRNFPLSLEQPYFRKLLQALGATAGVLRVLPYSFTVDEARDKGLSRLAIDLLGEQARLMLRPPLAYGDEPMDALQGLSLNDDSATLTVVLFNLSATPEQENHGALLDYLVRESTRGIGVLLDESGYLERTKLQAGSAARLAERVALWQQFCSFHKAPATRVNLLDPAAHPLDAGAGLKLSAGAA